MKNVSTSESARRRDILHSETFGYESRSNSAGISKGSWRKLREHNYCLTKLINKGLVKIQNFTNSKNKFRYIYVLTPKGIAEKSSLTRSFLRRKQEEYEIIKSQIAALRDS